MAGAPRDAREHNMAACVLTGRLQGRTFGKKDASDMCSFLQDFFLLLFCTSFSKRC